MLYFARTPRAETAPAANQAPTRPPVTAHWTNTHAHAQQQRNGASMVMSTADAATGGSGYIDYLAPGMMLMIPAYLLVGVAVMVATDMTKGIVNRFRTMPISQSSIESSRSFTCASRYSASWLLVFSSTRS